MARLNDCHLSCDIHKVHTYPTQALSVRLWWCHTFSLLGYDLMSKVCLSNIRFFHLSRISRKEMFSQRFSPTTGKMEWVVEDEDYDMRDEIARWARDLKYSRGVSITRLPNFTLRLFIPLAGQLIQTCFTTMKG